MLAVDVSFLLPDIINSDGLQTTSNLAVYISTLYSVGSLVVSILLVAQSQDYHCQAAEGGVCIICCS